MRLVVVSHKVCWASPSSPVGYATDGGFSRQIDALSELFDETVVCVPVTEPTDAARAGEVIFEGNVRIEPLPMIEASDLARKLRFPAWAARAGRILVREIHAADAVHAPVPGDVGTFGIAIAEALRKPLFVRYCGNWLVPTTRSQRLLIRWAERAAGGRRVILATGGGPEPPSSANPDVHWIFSTTLTQADVDELPTRPLDRPVQPRLVTVGRQEPYKGTSIIIEGLPSILADHPDTHLDVVGGGSGLAGFEALAAELGVDDHVTFHGQVGRHRVLDLLADADLFVFPTRSEGFPKAVAEALAVGLPVVTSPVSVLPHLVGDERGVMLDRNEPDCVAEAVRRICADPGRFRAMSESARETGRSLTLEAWTGQIGQELDEAWGSSLGTGGEHRRTP